MYVTNLRIGSKIWEQLEILQLIFQSIFLQFWYLARWYGNM